MNRFFLLIFTLSTFWASAQVEADSTKVEEFEDNKVLFSKDTLFVRATDSLSIKYYEQAAMIDSLWLNEMIRSPLYDTIPYVLLPDSIYKTEVEDLPTELLKERLAELNSKTPFHIEYNPSLEQIIRSYLNRRKSAFSNLLERARYYFPLF
mgnify:CR=1 FL=1